MTGSVTDVTDSRLEANAAREMSHATRRSLSSVPRQPPAPDPLFDEFWSVYPRKVGKVGAQRAWERITRKGAAARQIIAAASRFRDVCRADKIDQNFIPHPASWLRDGRYSDEEEPPASPSASASAVSIPQVEVVQLNDEQLIAAVARLGADHHERPLTTARAIIMLIRGQAHEPSVTKFPPVDAKRGRELAAMLYADYLQTPEWRERRKIMLRQAGHRCQVCNGTERLNVHHRTYERRGVEDPADLTVLCEGCHLMFHDNGKLVTGGGA